VSTIDVDNEPASVLAPLPRLPDHAAAFITALGALLRPGLPAVRANIFDHLLRHKRTLWRMEGGTGGRHGGHEDGMEVLQRFLTGETPGLAINFRGIVIEVEAQWRCPRCSEMRHMSHDDHAAVLSSQGRLPRVRPRNAHRSWAHGASSGASVAELLTDLLTEREVSRGCAAVPCPVPVRARAPNAASGVQQCGNTAHAGLAGWRLHLDGHSPVDDQGNQRPAGATTDIAVIANADGTLRDMTKAEFAEKRRVWSAALGGGGGAAACTSRRMLSATCLTQGKVLAVHVDR